MPGEQTLDDPQMPEKGWVPRPGTAYVFYGILLAILV